MKKDFFFKLTIATLIFVLSNTSSAFAAVLQQNEMVSTSSIVEDFRRTSAQQKRLHFFLNQDEVVAKLAKLGVDKEEALKRVSSLSLQELNQLSNQIESAKAGGDILYTILIIVLIVFLVKRI